MLDLDNLPQGYQRVNSYINREPGPCIACNGTGKFRGNGSCNPCNGKGHQTSARIKYEHEYWTSYLTKAGAFKKVAQPAPIKESETALMKKTKKELVAQILAA